MRKAAALDLHLERAVESAAFWGDCDCFLWPADWVRLSGWPDPAAAWRGRYRTALGASRIVRRAGGVEAMWRTEAARAGLRPTARPVPGDVGLVRRATADVGPTLSGLIGAINLGAGEWAVRTREGVRTGRWTAAEVWRVPWRRR